MSEFSKEEKAKIRQWLSDSFQAVKSLDGSEVSEEKVYQPLSLFDAFVRSKTNDTPTTDDEQKFVQAAFPTHPEGMPETVDGFLDAIYDFYTAFKKASNSKDIWNTLQNSGAIVKDTDQVFVKTDQGQLQEAKTDNSNSYKVRTEPRLAMLISHLRNDGVNGQPIYMDDLVITKGKTDPDMMREHPYNIVQIPRLNMEIAVCDQIGETTFVKRGTVGPEFWDHMSKDQLKARDDVLNVDKHNEDHWWKQISDFLSGNAQQTDKKVNVQSWSNKKPNLDMDLIDQSLLAHRLATGNWLTGHEKGEDGKRGNYVLEHGPYADLKISEINNALRRGSRSLTEKSSFPRRNKIISDTYQLDYKNRLDQNDLDMDLIDQTIFAHFEATGDWLTGHEKGENGKQGSYVLEHGPYKGLMTVGSLNTALRVDNARGLPGESSFAKRKAVISEIHDLDYSNHLDRDSLDMDMVDETLLAHFQATGRFLLETDPDEQGKKGKYVLEHGPYANQFTAKSLDNTLRKGFRGLEKSSISKRNSIIADKLGLDYSPRSQSKNAITPNTSHNDADLDSGPA